MNLLLQRSPSRNGTTIGRLSIDGTFFCFTCEDEIREGEKIAGKTAIPAGRYKIIITESNRFGRLLPLLVNVPGFAGIRIHPGNTAADTEGCILPGYDLRPDGVGRSRDAFNALYDKITKADEIWIEVCNP